MKDIYYLTLLVLTALGSSLTTLYLPAIKARIQQYKTRFKRKPKPVIDATQYFELSTRLDAVEKRLDKRQVNYRKAMREEIKNVLLKLKNEK